MHWVHVHKSITSFLESLKITRVGNLFLFFSQILLAKIFAKNPGIHTYCYVTYYIKE